MPVRVCPTWAVPLTVGRAVLTGTVPVAAMTAAVAAELAGRLGPVVLLAVTWSRSVNPTSAATGTYVNAVALPIGLQVAPVQRCHCWP